MSDWTAPVGDAYRHWFESGVTVVGVGDYAEITTPFLDRHNDFLQVYARRVGEDGYVITDDGAAIAELESSGVDISKSDTRSNLFASVLRAFNIIQAATGELTATANADNLGQRVNDLIQAVLCVEDMHVLATHRVQKMFYDDVAAFLADLPPETRIVPSADLLSLVQLLNAATAHFADLEVER